LAVGKQSKSHHDSVINTYPIAFCRYGTPGSCMLLLREEDRGREEEKKPEEKKKKKTVFLLEMMMIELMQSINPQTTSFIKYSTS